MPGVTAQDGLVAAHARVVIYVPGLGGTHGRMNKQIGFEFPRSTKGQFLVSPVHGIACLERHDPSPAHAPEARPHLGGRQPQFAGVIVSRQGEPLQAATYVHGLRVIKQLAYPRVSGVGRAKDLLRFAISTNLSGTINLVTRDSDILWLSALSNPLQVGYYKVAKAFMNVLLVPVTPLISTTYREVAREVAAKTWKNVRYLLRSGSIISAIWTIPASLILVFFGPYLVQIYGADFQPAYSILLILLVGVIAAALPGAAHALPCPCDCNDPPDGMVNVDDFLELLAHWGPCP